MTHYDVIILGESLASRIAAVLLAKAGRRVLAVGSPPASSPCPAWIPVSLHLERLLELLGGRSCLGSATPFQVLSGQVRLTLHGISALTDELRREFPADSGRVEMLLHDLKDLGNRLEAALWESGGLPLAGWTSRWRFLCQRLSKGLLAGKLASPLAPKLQAGTTARTAQALAALFSGLSLAPVERLSVAEGALLWRSFGDERGVSAGALNALLTHRFEQFHGEQAQSADLQSLQGAGRRLGEAVFQNGRRCTAETFLLGSREAGALLPAEFGAGAAAPAHPSPLEARVTEGGISPLLAPAVILDGSPSLRLTLVPDPAGGDFRVISQATAAKGMSPTDLDERLAALFPFATLRFKPQADVAAGAAIQKADRPRGSKAFPGASRSLVAGKNLLYCCGEQVLPALGATGEVMVGVSAANHLLRQKSR